MFKKILVISFVLFLLALPLVKGQNQNILVENTISQEKYQDPNWSCLYQVIKAKPSKSLNIQSSINYSIGEQRQLVILFNYQDQPNNKPWTVSYISDLLFNQVNAYYQNVSYGQTWITGDIVGWLTIPANSNDCQAATSTMAEDAARAAGYEPDNYIHKIYIHPSTACSPSGGVTFYSTGSDLSVKTWIFLSGDVSFYAMAHEFGHSLHFSHSNALDCGPSSFGETCTHIEYGDHHDVMGAYGITGVPNMYHRDKVGYLSSQVQEVTQDGTFILTPVENVDGNLKTIKILQSHDFTLGVSRYYYFEFRQGTGVFLRLGHFSDFLFNPNSEDTLGSELLDCSPLTSSFDEQLITGKSYYDSNLQLLVTVNNFDSTGANVSVAFGVAPPPPPPPPPVDTISPTISITSPTNGSRIGKNSQVSVTCITSDNVGVTRVELYVDNNLIQSTTTAPFSTKWNARKAANGNHSIFEIAYDAAGNIGQSQTISVIK